MENENIEIVKEKYVQVCESRIKNTIKEYRKAQPFNSVLSISFGCIISFFIAFVSYSSSDTFWKWTFLILLSISGLVFTAFGIVSLVRKKIGKGTEKWFLEEITNKHPLKYKDAHSGAGFLLDSKIIFNIVNIILIIGIPTSVILIVLGCNNWSLADKEWANIFWVSYGLGTAGYLVFGTYINAYFAYLFFGYEDGFPNIPIY